MSRKQILLVTVFAACTSATVQSHAAGDDWTGWYLGGNLGYGWGNSTDKTTTVFSPTGYFAASSVPAINSAGDGKTKPDGWTGGVTGGYNWQSGKLVYGLEADLEAMNLKGSRTSTATYPCCAPTSFTITQTTKANNLFMARGRVGYAEGRALYYFTGGVSVTDLKVQDSFSDNFATAAASNSTKGTKTSYVVGVGLEYKLQSMWTAKIEYLHFDFGGVSGTSNNLTAFNPPVAFPTNTFTSSANLRTDVVRVGMNYRF